MKDKSIRMMCEGALMVALAQILGYLKLMQLPQGGSITLNMLPIFLFCARWGWKPGFLASFSLGILQLILDGAYTWGWQSILLDYLLAYGCLGASGIFYQRPKGLFTGIITASLLRFLFHCISGVLFVRNVTSFEIYGIHTASPWLYSVLYNGSYLLPASVAVLMVAALLKKSIPSYIHPQNESEIL